MKAIEGTMKQYIILPAIALSDNNEMPNMDSECIKPELVLYY